MLILLLTYIFYINALAAVIDVSFFLYILVKNWFVFRFCCLHAKLSKVVAQGVIRLQ